MVAVAVVVLHGDDDSSFVVVVLVVVAWSNAGEYRHHRRRNDAWGMMIGTAVLEDEDDTCTGSVALLVVQHPDCSRWMGIQQHHSVAWLDRVVEA